MRSVHLDARMMNLDV